jgi:hypothetical protein
MTPMKVVLLAAALSLGPTMAVAQEGGAGEKPTQPYALDPGSNFDENPATAPSWRGPAQSYPGIYPYNTPGRSLDGRYYQGE